MAGDGGGDAQFSTASLLEIEVSEKSLKDARDKIEGRLGSVAVDVSTSGGGGSDRASRERALSRQVLSNQSDSLSAIAESWERDHHLSQRRNELLTSLVRTTDQGFSSVQGVLDEHLGSIANDADGGAQPTERTSRERAFSRQLLSDQSDMLSGIAESWERDHHFSQRRNELLTTIVRATNQGFSGVEGVLDERLGSIASDAGGQTQSTERASRERAFSRQLLASQDQSLTTVVDSWDESLMLDQQRNELLEELVRATEKGGFTEAQQGGMNLRLPRRSGGGGGGGGLIGGAVGLLGALIAAGTAAGGDGDTPSQEPTPVETPRPIPVDAPSSIPVENPGPLPVETPQPIPVDAPSSIPVTYPGPSGDGTGSESGSGSDTGTGSDSGSGSESDTGVGTPPPAGSPTGPGSPLQHPEPGSGTSTSSKPDTGDGNGLPSGTPDGEAVVGGAGAGAGAYLAYKRLAGAGSAAASTGATLPANFLARQEQRARKSRKKTWWEQIFGDGGITSGTGGGGMTTAMMTVPWQKLGVQSARNSARQSRDGGQEKTVNVNIDLSNAPSGRNQGISDREAEHVAEKAKEKLQRELTDGWGTGF